MEKEMDISEDELELERLVFGDSKGIQKRLSKQKPNDKLIPSTDLEQLEDGEVYST